MNNLSTFEDSSFGGSELKTSTTVSKVYDDLGSIGFSSIDFYKADYEKCCSFEVEKQYCNNIDDFYLSIELAKNRMKDTLSQHFEFKSPDKEINFLEKNTYLIGVLESLGAFIKNNFKYYTRIELDLIMPKTEWQTLYINVYTNADWETSHEFQLSFINFLYKHYSSFTKLLNISLIPDEF
jgi:hypothetical protein